MSYPQRNNRRMTGQESQVMRRISAYIRTILRRMPYYRIDAEKLAKRMKCSLRAVRYALMLLREVGTLEFALTRKRVGSVWQLVAHRSVSVCSDTNASFCNRSGVQTMTIGQSPSTTLQENPNTGNKSQLKKVSGRVAPSRVGEDKPLGKVMNRFAWGLARRLARYHWDNCKVVWRLGHCYRYAARALQHGYRAICIERAYDIELHESHKTATDVGLLVGDPTLLFEPSACVKRAAELLGRSGVGALYLPE